MTYLVSDKITGLEVRLPDEAILDTMAGHTDLLAAVGARLVVTSQRTPNVRRTYRVRTGEAAPPDG